MPIIVFVARDHNLINIHKIFDNVEKDDIVIAKIIGVRFELGDPNITTIADILQPRSKKRIIIYI